MLKQFLIVFFIWVNYAKHIAFAQDTTNTKLKKWGIGVQVNTVDKFSPYSNYLSGIDDYHDDKNEVKRKGISIGLIARHCIKENTLLGFEVGMTNINFSIHNDTRNQTKPVDFITGDGKVSQKIYYISPFINWNIIKSNTIALYTGMELPINIYSDYVEEYNGTTFTDSTYTSIIFTTNDKIVSPGGFSVGPGALLGFNIRALKYLNIGAEFSSALLYYKFNGNVTLTHIQPSATGSSYLFSKEGFGILTQKLSFNISYWF